MVLKCKFLFSLTCTTRALGVPVGLHHLSCGKCPVFPEEVGIFFTTRLPLPWWDVASYGSPGLCVPGTAFMHSEAARCTSLSYVSWLPLPGFATMGEQGEVVCVFVGLFFSIISATVSTDHLSWKIMSAASP